MDDLILLNFIIEDLEEAEIVAAANSERQNDLDPAQLSNTEFIKLFRICDSELRIINMNSKYRGSSNDAFTWSNSNVQTLLRQFHAAGYTDYFLLGDPRYPLRTWFFCVLEIFIFGVRII
ncbi:hypothetical protein FQA39_LY17991 [Lamprigera yunnana]|nr:hypothetical protein FQA39_LY17991 [Lamprigera yunnana]